jgi:hypothetical protein
MPAEVDAPATFFTNVLGLFFFERTGTLDENSHGFGTIDLRLMPSYESVFPDAYISLFITDLLASAL